MQSNFEVSAHRAYKQSYLLVIAVLYSAFLILSNLAENKICEIHGIFFAGGLIFFPVTYIFDDIITEVYGFSASRRIIWLVFIANIIVVLGLFLVIYAPQASSWENQEALESVYLQSPRILLASFISFLFGEFINSIVLAKLKVRMKGKHFWFRAILSSIFGVLIENTIFCFIAFSGTAPIEVIWNMIITAYLFKLLYEILALPLTYRAIAFLKRREGLDHYDFNTSFNPFIFEKD